MLHLKSLPPATTHEIISYYFEGQGNDVEVTSFKMVATDEAVVSVSGLTNEGSYSLHPHSPNPARIPHPHS